MVAIIAIWGTLIINLILTVAGYTWYLQEAPKPDKQLPEKDSLCDGNGTRA
ncbi:hypothetical protein C7M44_01221 [Pediococcus pentosaceus]|nr:hypothetical protein C7M44_01221 [Pediococcus pentosaceus]